MTNFWSKSYLNRFFGDQNGAVTVDWVVLAGMAIATVFTLFTVFSPLLRDSFENLGGNMNEVIATGVEGSE